MPPARTSWNSIPNDRISFLNPTDGRAITATPRSGQNTAENVECVTYSRHPFWYADRNASHQSQCRSSSDPASRTSSAPIARCGNACTSGMAAVTAVVDVVDAADVVVVLAAPLRREIFRQGRSDETSRRKSPCGLPCSLPDVLGAWCEPSPLGCGATAWAFFRAGKRKLAVAAVATVLVASVSARRFDGLASLMMSSML